MWPHTVRILAESGAPLGFFENVPGLLSSGYFGDILGDLAEAGFNAEWCVLGADDVGAPHRRKRLWILAYAHGSGERLLARAVGGAKEALRRQAAGYLPEQRGEVSGGGADAADSAAISPWLLDPADLEHPISKQLGDTEEGRDSGTAGRPSTWEDDWLVEPYVGRVAHGVASRLDRLRALGNGQVPQAMAAAFTYLAKEAGILDDEQD